MLIIAILAFAFSQKTDGIVNAIPTLGALALGAQRLLPVLQQGYASWSAIRGGQALLQDSLELLDLPLPFHADNPSSQVLPFKTKIELEKVGFSYDPQTPYVLKEVNLTISKGSRIGFIGTTGSGKSTLLDIVMGLLQPTDGKLKIDCQEVTIANCRAWQAHIAHVPQVIFLIDSTIEENIALGIPKDQIDKHRVRQSAKVAQISDSIEKLPNQYQTLVGERGIRLSGGQRQRLGIARAIYKQADVIIFDEASSALDNETEYALMQAIDNLSPDLTILIIAHRVTTLKNCSEIVELSGGKIHRISSYQDLISSTFTRS